MLWSCDTPSTSFEGSIETIERITGAELEKKVSSLSAGKTGYTCSVSTWDMPGSEKQNTHISSIHYFPDNMVEQASGKTRIWTFVLTNSSVASSHRYGEHENVVQVARCNLPDVEGIEEEMTDRLMHINPATNSTKLTSAESPGRWSVHATAEKSASSSQQETQNLNLTSPMSGPCFSGVFLQSIFYYHCNGG